MNENFPRGWSSAASFPSHHSIWESRILEIEMNTQHNEKMKIIRRTQTQISPIMLPQFHKKLLKNCSPSSHRSVITEPAMPPRLAPIVTVAYAHTGSAGP